MRRRPRHVLVRADIADHAAMRAGVRHAWQPDAVMHLAAETPCRPLDRRPGRFVQTNVVGTFTLLDAAREYWPALPAPRRAAFRFHHVSTDEVFGALGAGRSAVHRNHAVRPAQPLFRQQGRLRPSGARLAPHLWPADHRQQHRQQLRPLAVPREADPAGDAQRARGQDAAGLWRRLQHARLDLRRGSCRGAGAGRSSAASPAPPMRIGARQPRTNLAGGARHLRRARRQRCPTRPGRASG